MAQHGVGTSKYSAINVEECQERNEQCMVGGIRLCVIVAAAA